MSLLRRLLDLALAGALLAALILVAGDLLPRETAQRWSGVPRVADGDTLIFGETRLRLRGIDAPELAQTCGEPAILPCGRIARAALRGIVRAGTSCEGNRTDRYARPLVTCRSPDGRDVASRMVAAGQAVATGCCRAEEAAARRARRGLWAAPFQHPAEWRKAEITRPD